MNAPAHHAITLAAPRDIASGKAPVILQRNDEDFIEAILEDLKSPASRSGLQSDLAATRNADQILKLFQPTQRLFHVALIEAWCATPGTPRLDPARVDAAGICAAGCRQNASATARPTHIRPCAAPARPLAGRPSTGHWPSSTPGENPVSSTST